MDSKEVHLFALQFANNYLTIFKHNHTKMVLL